MKRKFETGWFLSRKPDLCIERCVEPKKLDLEAAVDWVKRNKPMLWVGSIFSVPEPTAIPSGYALTRSLLALIFPPSDDLPELMRESLINGLIPKWPLERLLDEFELLGYDLSDSLLDFFAERDSAAAPNMLHESVVRFYEQGFSAVPLCVTTNWDTLLEKAFRSKDFSVRVGPHLDKTPNAGKAVSICHPHGSFESKDVVCSYVREQQPLTLHPDVFSNATLFLGYSGYEPSLYRYLEHDAGQLWCVRDETDFAIPTKRRLLCRPNTFVYVGDMQQLLRALGVLDHDVTLGSKYLARDGAIPPKVLEIIRMGIAAGMDSRACTDILRDVIFTPYKEPEMTFRFERVVSAINNHIRNRSAHAELPVALMAAARFQNDEQIWYGLISYLLRFGPDLHDEVIQRFLTDADEAKKKRGLRYSEGAEIFIRARSRCYKAYVGKPEREHDDASSYMLSQYSGAVLGDLALSGELAEVSAFSCLRKNEIERAKGYFDTAASYYYLTGLWNGGKLCEWACKNLESLKSHAAARSLRMPQEAFDQLRVK